ncbi:DUF6634 family protein [Paracoccus litorisediminis]|uniref:ATP-dependent Lon protease n=1 Tax=Paracoccus litorisediminis TaxID=2006130 RepID=A0A844HTN7_9RHOB|nr:DUF6634 family protein [Paracoccus litorisediminis]MTH60892.1 ATP-dependent Lon protease [Paracoccus litorisediminis]
MEFTSEQRIWFDRVLAAVAAAETGPSDADIASAPALDRWRPAISPQGHLILWGTVSGHPILGDNHITTSQLIAINAAAGWARTVSRWYRLAQPLAAFESDLMASMGPRPAEPARMLFELPGFQSIEDLELLPRLLAAYIRRVRELDAMDRASRLAAKQTG